MTHTLPAGLSNGVLLVDPAGLITVASSAIEQQFGYPAGELIGQPLALLLPAGTSGGRVVGRRRDGTEFGADVQVTAAGMPTGAHQIVIVSDASARLDAEGRLEVARLDQLAFERLVAELSSQFINLPADKVHDVIVDAFERIAGALDLDRATFFRIDADGTATAPIYWRRDGVPAPPAPVALREQFPWAYETILAGRLLCFSVLDEIPSDVDRENYGAGGIKSALTVPLSVGNRVIGGVGFNAFREERSWPPEVIHRLKVFATAFGNLLARREVEESLHQALGEVKRLRDQLHAENVYLRSEVRERVGSDMIVGDSTALRRVLDQVAQVSATSSTVLLVGETGTGKELFATRVHELSVRRGRTMVRVNCAAIPATLMESELFGRERGAYTGALSRQIGRFELANNSSIFLDEIGDLAPEVQVKLLRVLEERQIERLGSPQAIKVDTRIIAATHRNLEKLVADGTFREDLFYRLNVFPIHVPPLRERTEDIPLLVARFVDEFSRLFGKPIRSIAPDDMAALAAYSWPGNIRELRNVVERAMIVATSPRLAISPPASNIAAAKKSERLADVEAEHLRRVLDRSGWRIRGAGGAAERLGLPPTTLETRMAKLGVKRQSRS